MPYENRIVTTIESRAAFQELQKKNPGLIIIKFGAEWCGPCKQIAPIIEEGFRRSPENVLCIEVDIDECFDLYAYLKSKKMVGGIPVVLCYKKGNLEYAPDLSVVGANTPNVVAFFNSCYRLAAEVSNI